MRGRPTREGVSDSDLAVRTAMDEVLARERLERAVGLEPELLGPCARSTLLGRPSLAKRRRIQK